jgi:hypothetical protein
VPSPQKSRRLLLIKPAELLLFSTGADTEDDLVLLNRYSPVKLSANLLAKFYRVF